MPYISAAFGLGIVVILATFLWDKERRKDGAALVAVSCYTALLFGAGMAKWLLNSDVMPPGEVLSRVFVPLMVSLVALPVGMYLFGLRRRSLLAAIPIWNIGMPCLAVFVGFVGLAVESLAVLAIAFDLILFMLVIDFPLIIGLVAVGLRRGDTRRATGTALLLGGMAAAVMGALLYLPDLEGWPQANTVEVWTIAIALGPVLFCGVRLVLPSIPSPNVPSDDIRAEWSRLLKRSGMSSDPPSADTSRPPSPL